MKSKCRGGALAPPVGELLSTFRANLKIRPYIGSLYIWSAKVHLCRSYLNDGTMGLVEGAGPPQAGFDTPVCRNDYGTSI